MTVRGRVLRDTNAGPGLLAAGGKQYSFTLENMWQSELPPRLGMPVEIDFGAEGRPESVRMVPDTQVAQEQAAAALAEARRHGERLTDGLRSRFRIPTLLAESLMLLCFFLLLNLRMGNAFNKRAVNGWDAIGLNPATTATNDHGLLSLLAVAGLLAPLAVPFVRHWWARWLYAGPLVFCAAAIASLWYEIDSVGRAAQQQIGAVFGAQAVRGIANPADGLFHPAVGAFAVLLCAGYLARQTRLPRVA